MRIFLFLFFGFTSLILETTVLQAWPSGLVRFDLPFLMVIYLALHEEQTELGLFATLMLGLMTDALGAVFLGQMSLIYAVLYLFFRALRPHVFLESTMANLSVIAFLSLIKELLNQIQMGWMGFGLPITTKLIFTLAMQIGWNVLLGVFIFMPLKRIFPPIKSGV